MKKILLVFLAFILAIFVIAGIFGYVQYQRYDKQFGITEAPPVSHETFITPNTRTQVVINPEQMKGFIQHHLPPGVKLPSYLESFFTMEDLLNRAMPHRIAIMANSDVMQGVINFHFFLNERMGGPLIVSEVTKQNLLQKISPVTWDPAGVQMPARGIIQTSGSFPLPEGMDEFIFANATLGGAQKITPIEGRHLIQISIDNGNAELMAFTGLAMDALWVDWKNIFGAKEFKMALPLFNKTNTVNLYADMLNDDELAIHLRVDALPETEFIFNMIKSMGMPEIKRYLSEIYQLELSGDPAWSKEENAFIGDFTLKGVEKYMALPFNNIRM